MTDQDTTDPTDVQYADLSAFQWDTLVVLLRLESMDEDNYGLAIKRHLVERYGEDVNHGRLYPNLDKLIDMGLVERGQIDKRTNRYTLTARGRTLLREHAAAVSELVDGMEPTP
jgi:DNA-binding PadR family transcriptional regulator